MRVLGVDPGARGALAVVENDEIEVHDMPMLLVRRGRTDKAEVDGYALGALLRGLMVDAAYVELVGGIQGQSASAAFNFGRAAGAVEYALKALQIPVERVPPLAWKRELKVAGAGKDAARLRASSLFPFAAHNFKRAKDADRAEAALIAEFGRRVELRKVAPLQQRAVDLFS